MNLTATTQWRTPGGFSRKASFFAATIATLFALVGTNAFAQTTYTWSGGAGPASWAVSTNWTPTRTTPAVDDIMVIGTTATINAIPVQTIGELHISTGTTATLVAAVAGNTLTLQGGASAADLDVPAGATMTQNSTALNITLLAAATGTIGGTVNGSNGAQKIIGNAPGAIQFLSGSFANQTNAGGNFTGSWFGNAAGQANSVVFQSGSTFAINSGGNPFALSQPASVAVFQTGSLYRQDANTSPSLGGRIYADFEYNNSGASTSTSAVAFSMDNVTVSQGTLNIGSTANWTIKGNITVKTGTIFNANPASAGTIVLGGSSTQTIATQGTGSFTSNTNQTFQVNNAAGVSIGSNITMNTLQFAAGKLSTGANTLTIPAGGNVTGAGAGTGWVIGNLKHTLVPVALAASRTFHVGDASNYTPVLLATTNLPSNYDLTATTAAGDHANIGTSILDGGKSVNRTWTVTGAAPPGGATFAATFNFVAGDLDGPTNTNNVVVGKYDSPTWTYPTVGTKTATSTQVTGVGSFSGFQIAEIASYTITSTAGANGTIAPLGATPVTGGGSQGYTITPDGGFSVLDVKVDGNSVGAVTSYTFTNVTADHTIDAQFASNVFTINASATGPGAIAPSGSVSVTGGNDQTFTMTPTGACDHIVDVVVDGVSRGAVASYTFLAVNANHTIDATFAVTQYTITATAGANGTISDLGPTPVNCGTDKTYTITPAACYHVLDVTVDAVSRGAVTSYTFLNVQGDHTIDAQFALNTYTILSTQGPNGTINPLGSTPLNCGADQSYTITPDGGFAIADVKVDGNSVGPVASYSFLNVQADHTIAATFVSNAMYTLTVTTSGSGTVNIAPPGPTYLNGTVVTLTPNAGAGSHFDVWSGDASGHVSPLMITMDADKTVNAAFLTNVYSWNQSGSAAWTTPGNWTPTRWAPNTDDVLNFDNGAVTTATGVVNESIGQLFVLNSTDVKLIANASVKIALAGGAGTDFDVAAGSTLRFDSNAQPNRIAITLPVGANGTVSGTIVTRGVPQDPTLANVIATNHKITSLAAGGLHFKSGALYDQGFGFSGNIFGVGTAIDTTGAPGSVIFEAGSTFQQSTGSNPFGGSGAFTVTIFQTSSLYRLLPPPAGYTNQITPSMSGRSYADWECAITGTVSTSGGQPCKIDNWTITSGTMNSGMTGTFDVKGNILVKPGATLNCNAAAGIVTMSGTATQSINATGATLTATSGTVLDIKNGGLHVSLGSNIVWAGSVQFTSGRIITGSNFFALGASSGVNGAGQATGYFQGNLRRNLTAAGGTVSRQFDVGDATTYAPVVVKMNGVVPANGATDVLAFTTAGDHPLIASSTLNPSRSVNRYYSLTQSPTATTFVSYDATFNFPAGDVDAGSTTSQFIVRRYDLGSAAWDGTTNGTRTATSTQCNENTFGSNGSSEYAIGNVQTYTLSLTIVGPGSASKIPNQPTYNSGTHVTLQAFADLNAHFVGWSGDATGNTNPLDVTMDSDKSITATFALDQYALTTSVVGNGSITRSPNAASYNIGTVVSLEAVADAHWTFVEWSGDLTGSTNPQDITMDSDKSVTATFVADQTVLTVVIDGGGTVNRSPNQATYNYGSTVGLTAVPNPGWVFTVWTGAVTGPANPINVVMNGDRTVVAHFADTQGPQVTVTFPNGGEVLLVGQPYDFTWTATDNDGVTQVDLYISRDNGATYQAIAFNVPNTGSYVWTVTPPGTNSGVTPQFTAYFMVVATDPSFNQGSDASDAGFSIFDLATSVVVTRLDAETVDNGVAVKWAMAARGIFQTVSLERADAEVGPWNAVSADLKEDGDLTVATDYSALGGQTYWYRLVGTTAGGQKATFGPVQGVSGTPKEFSLSSAWPNPSTTGELNLQFSVSKSVNLKLHVLDVQGRLVQKLADGDYRPGRYQVKWDGRTDHGTAAAGVYFVRYITPEKSFTTRFVIAK